MDWILISKTTANKRITAVSVDKRQLVRTRSAVENKTCSPSFSQRYSSSVITIIQIPTWLRNISLKQSQVRPKSQQPLPRSGHVLYVPESPWGSLYGQWWWPCLTKCWAGTGTGQKNHCSWDRCNRFPQEQPLKQVLQSESHFLGPFLQLCVFLIAYIS